MEIESDPLSAQEHATTNRSSLDTDPSNLLTLSQDDDANDDSDNITTTTEDISQILYKSFS